MSGRYAVDAPVATARPLSTVAPASPARAIVSRASRDLPTPAGPTTAMAPPVRPGSASPSVRRRTAISITCSSGPRPISGANPASPTPVTPSSISQMPGRVPAIRGEATGSPRASATGPAGRRPEAGGSVQRVAHDDAARAQRPDVDGVVGVTLADAAVGLECRLLVTAGDLVAVEADHLLLDPVADRDEVLATARHAGVDDAGLAGRLDAQQLLAVRQLEAVRQLRVAGDDVEGRARLARVLDLVLLLEVLEDAPADDGDDDDDDPSGEGEEQALHGAEFWHYASRASAKGRTSAAPARRSPRAASAIVHPEST